MAIFRVQATRRFLTQSIINQPHPSRWGFFIYIMEKLTPSVAEIQVSYMPVKQEQIKVVSSADAYRALFPHFPSQTVALQERFVVGYLNQANYITSVYGVSVGGITGTVADPRLILGVALQTAAVGIILCHNHPSGNLKPSQNDRLITDKIKMGADLLDIRLLDHLIIDPHGKFFSFADEGLV